MYKFEQYNGKQTACPALGKRILRLSNGLSSFSIDTCIYQNGDQLFYVYSGAGIPSMEQILPAGAERYHLAIVMPIIREDLLVKYLHGTLHKGNLFNQHGDCYVLKLDAPTYTYEWGGKMVREYTMHPVKDDKEVTRKIQLEVSQFNLLDCKSVIINELPELIGLKYCEQFTYDHKKELNFYLLSKEDEAEIDAFTYESTLRNSAIRGWL